MTFTGTVRSPRTIRRDVVDSCSFPCSAMTTGSTTSRASTRRRAERSAARDRRASSARSCTTSSSRRSSRLAGMRREAHRARGRRARAELDALRCASRRGRLRLRGAASWRRLGRLRRARRRRPNAAQHVADGLSAAEFDGGVYKTRPGQCRQLSRVGSRSSLPGGDPSRDRRRGAARPDHRRVREPRARAGERARQRPDADASSPTAWQPRPRGVGLDVEVLDERQIRDLGMGLLLGVGQGSAEPPRVIVLRHRPARRPAARSSGSSARASRSTPAASRSSRPTAWSG